MRLKFKTYSDRYVLIVGNISFRFVRYMNYWYKPDRHNYIYILPSIMYENDWDDKYIHINWLRWRFTIEICNYLGK